MMLMLKLNNPDSVSLSPNPNIYFNNNFDSSFGFNQTSYIFHPKILYALFSIFNLPYINSDLISYISTLNFFAKKVLPLL